MVNCLCFKGGQIYKMSLIIRSLTLGNVCTRFGCSLVRIFGSCWQGCHAGFISKKRFPIQNFLILVKWHKSVNMVMLLWWMNSWASHTVMMCKCGIHCILFVASEINFNNFRHWTAPPGKNSDHNGQTTHWHGSLDSQGFCSKYFTDYIFMGII